MSNGFAYWYEQDWTPQRAADRLTSLDSAGLRLEHPTTGRITAVSTAEETAGEQIEVDRSTLLARAAVEVDQEFDFQCWIDVDIDVFCAIERLAPDLAVQRFYLDGLTLEQQRLVVGVMFDQIRVSPRATRGWIVDRTGGSGDQDWDALVTGAPGRVTVRANVIALSSDVAAQHLELHVGTPLYLDDLVVYDPDGLLPAIPKA